MDVEAIGNSPIGKLVPLLGSDAKHGEFAYFAYLPEDLPEDFPNLASATWTSVNRASSALARLDEACRQLPDARLLIRPALWREALDTSALEGTVGALQDLLEAQLPSTQFLTPETREIRAFERVAMYAFTQIKERPITVAFLCELQGEMLREAPRRLRDLGAIRTDPVWIGVKDRPIQESRFVPAPPDDRLRAGLDAWEAWVQKEHANLPTVLRAAVAHYQFETLHPFGDGNGRIGRLVVILQLLHAGDLKYPAVTLSPWFLRRRLEYQDHLLAVTETGEWDPWIQFFCQAIEDQAASLAAGASRLWDWLKEATQLVHDRRWTGAIHRLLEDLIEWPVTTISDTAVRYRVSQMNATRMIGHLVEAGILEELTGRSYGRIYGARYVIDTVEGI